MIFVYPRAVSALAFNSPSSLILFYSRLVRRRHRVRQRARWSVHTINSLWSNKSKTTTTKTTTIENEIGWMFRLDADLRESLLGVNWDHYFELWVDLASLEFPEDSDLDSELSTFLALSVDKWRSSPGTTIGSPQPGGIWRLCVRLHEEDVQCHVRDGRRILVAECFTGSWSESRCFQESWFYQIVGKNPAEPRPPGNSIPVQHCGVGRGRNVGLQARRLQPPFWTTGNQTLGPNNSRR